MNRFIAKIICSIAILFTLTLNTASAAVASVKNEYVVSFDKSVVHSEALEKSLQKKGIRTLSLLNASERIVKINYVSKQKSQANIIKELKKLMPSARIVEPNYIYYASFASPAPKTPPPPVNDARPTFTPNDVLFGSLWGMKNIGQADPSGQIGIPNVDSSASKAWVKQNDASNVIVAVIDSGVDYKHPDLAENMWKGKDSNGNTIHGFNAIKDNFDPMDDNGHGTHVAGTIGAVGNNAIGVTGVAWKTQIMGIKFLSASGSGTSADAVKSIDFAVENGAHVMNNSWGSRGAQSQVIKEAIERANEAGVVFVAAAGNNGKSNDGSSSSISYPASYKLDNVISVAATDNSDRLASFSNYGKNSVHLMAPGVNIQSTSPSKKYKNLSGTSMATPHVTGAVALLLERSPQLRPIEIRERLMRSSDKMNFHKEKIISSGRLNVYNLITNKEGSVR